MPPGRAKAWVDSLPEYELDGAGYANAVLVTSQYPYCFAVVYRPTHYVEVKQTADNQHIWVMSENGAIVEAPRPSANDLKQALNLPEPWNLGYVASGEPNTSTYHYKVSTQE